MHLPLSVERYTIMLSSRGLIEGICCAEERRFGESYRSMEELKIKKALAPAKWEELKAALKDQCAQMMAVSPVHLVMEESTPFEFSVANPENGGAAQLRYEGDVPCIVTTVGGKSADLFFRVSQDGTSIQIVQGPFVRNVAEIALELIRRIH
jgi:hypothetical protein